MEKSALIKEIERLKKENNSLKGNSSIVEEKLKRNSSGLKDVLFQQLDNVLGDNPDYKKANTVAKMVKTITDVSKVELEYAKFSFDVQKSRIEHDGNIKKIDMR